MESPETLTAALSERALALGFARIGFARAEPLDVEGERLRTFVAEGRHADMEWLARTVEVRIDPGHEGMLPGAMSVAVLVAPYARTPEEVGPRPGRVARYARGRDYHNVLGRRMQKLETFLRERGHAARASVDSRPVFERAWAERAGVGFVGKNCCLIVPGIGSHVFLACLVTTAELVPTPRMSPRCGACTLCLTACPTGAFSAERTLDARRCISYLTIERAGPIDPELRAPMGDWLFGCDVCQDVCPYNATSAPPEETTASFAPSPRLSEVSAEDLLCMEPEAFRAWAEGSPLRRAGAEQMARNAAIVLGNRGARRHLPVLAEAAAGHASETVRDAARWAGARIAAREEPGDQSSGGSG